MRQTTIADFYPSFIDEVYSFNQQAGLLEAGYDDFLESSFQIEEALEGFGDLPYLQCRLHSEGESVQELCTPKELARQIVRLAEMGSKPTSIPDVDRLDKACDAIVFAFGSIFKLGLNPEQAARAVSIVMSANLQKLSMPKDEFGKLTKPESFVGPEVQLQALLDARQAS